jgi:hypothetical protein
MNEQKQALTYAEFQKARTAIDEVISAQSRYPKFHSNHVGPLLLILYRFHPDIRSWARRLGVDVRPFKIWLDLLGQIEPTHPAKATKADEAKPAAFAAIDDLRGAVCEAWSDDSPEPKPVNAGAVKGKADSSAGRRKGRQTRKRTPSIKQLEALKVVGECKQNFAEAGRWLGLDPKTVRQRYEAGLKNAGKLAGKFIGKPEIQRLKEDWNGRADVAGDDDGQAVSMGRRRVTRDKR